MVRRRGVPSHRRTTYAGGGDAAAARRRSGLDNTGCGVSHGHPVPTLADVARSGHP